MTTPATTDGTVTCPRCKRHVYISVTVEKNGVRVCDPAHKIMGTSCAKLAEAAARYKRMAVAKDTGDE